MLHVLCNSPHTHVLADRPFPNLFSEDDLALLEADAPLPSAGLSTALRDRLVQMHSTVNSSPAIYKTQLEGADVVTKELLSDPARLVYAMITSISPEEMENTERLCVVTSSLALLMRENVCRGEAGVLAVLKRLQEIDETKKMRKKKSKLPSSFDGESALSSGCLPQSSQSSGYTSAGDKPNSLVKGRSDQLLLTNDVGSLVSLAALNIRCDVHHETGHINCGKVNALQGAKTCNKGLAVDEFCENVLDFGCCRPPSMVDSFVQKHSGCVSKNFFRLLCVWLAHYACSQRYVETLYYCTHVPYAEWKQTALFVW
jgi:hypothetical protein